MNFNSLHNHTEYSLLDGYGRPEGLVRVCSEMGYRACAITDHGNMAGAYKFYRAGKEAGIVPIVGMEAYITAYNPSDKVRDGVGHLVLLARSLEGYKALCGLSKRSWTEGFYYKPRVWIEWLKGIRGVVCLTACVDSWMAEDTENRYGVLKGIFGDDLYLELQCHGAWDRQIEWNKKLLGLDGRYVLTNDVHYWRSEQWVLQEHFYKMQDGDRKVELRDLYLKTDTEIVAELKAYHSYIGAKARGCFDAIDEIIDKCSGFEFEKRRWIPGYAGRDLADEVEAGLGRELAKIDDLTESVGRLWAERALYEYKIIHQYGLDSYFLIAQDVVEWARSKGIMVGFGRGSACGSLICYLLGITKVNPLDWGLYFERFLNEVRCSRGELADIDMDFAARHRDDVKHYIVERFGSDHVCGVGSYNRMMLKGAIKDFSRNLGLDYGEVNRITTEMADEVSPALKELYHKKPELEYVVGQSVGQVRSLTLHPAAVVILPEEHQMCLPVKTQLDGEDRIVTTQYDGEDLAKLGFMKFDILGIKEYDVFTRVIELVERRGEKIDLDKISLTDDKVFDFFRHGETDGVFQFGGEQARQVLMDIRPEGMRDLIAANALNRPGPLENRFHVAYGKRKRGEEAIEYPHESVKDVLEGTYGLICFQEQVMEIIHKIGGVDLSVADEIRAALGKKKEDVLATFKTDFIKGAFEKVGDRAEEIWNQLQRFASYSFNAAHSTVYSLVAYTSQYLKVHYPVEYWAAVMDEEDDIDELYKLKAAAERMGVAFILPDINQSRGRFEIADGKIVWSLSKIKGVGPRAVEEIERARGSGFTSALDMWQRVKMSRVAVESLILAGVFGQPKAQVDILIASKFAKRFGESDLVTYRHIDFMVGFKDRVGFYQKSFKLDSDLVFSSGVGSADDFVSLDPDQPFKCGGLIVGRKKHRTVNNEEMAFFAIEDADGAISCTVMPGEWLMYKEAVKEGHIVEVEGIKNVYKKKTSLLVKNICQIS